MQRGQVISEQAVAWLAGRLAAREYFAWARRRAAVSALSSVRERLRHPGADSHVPPADPDPEGAA